MDKVLNSRALTSCCLEMADSWTDVPCSHTTHNGNNARTHARHLCQQTFTQWQVRPGRNIQYVLARKKYTWTFNERQQPAHLRRLASAASEPNMEGAPLICSGLASEGAAWRSRNTMPRKVPKGSRTGARKGGKKPLKRKSSLGSPWVQRVKE